MTQRNNGQILPLLPRHISQIARIEQLCFSDPWSEAVLESELEAPLARYFVYEEDGQVLGYIGTRMIFDTCEIANVAVDPAHRRKGIAQTLYRALEAECRETGIVQLDLEVRESNVGAQEFYRICGFTVVGKRRNYYESPREDAILMSRLLGETEEKA
jgi:ribosomal-protein-alanine N-acetyltransferase